MIILIPLWIEVCSQATFLNYEFCAIDLVASEPPKDAIENSRSPLKWIWKYLGCLYPHQGLEVGHHNFDVLRLYDEYQLYRMK